MLRHRWLALVVAFALVLSIAGCKGSSGDAGGAVGASDEPAVPAAFDAASSGAVDLDITADGGGVAIASGDATAAIHVPAGAATAGASWRVTPLATAPDGVKKPLCPGVYVDTKEASPSGMCSIGFALPGKASENATIVKISEDGLSSEIVPTERMETGGMTILTAYVDGFSPYTTAEEDAAARDQAFQDRAKAKGQEVDWTIKAGGTETQTNEGWTFNYELDFFASGGGAGMGGAYDGHASLSIDGEYEGQMSIVSSFGTVKGIGRDQKLRFWIVDAPLASLLTGEDVGDPVVSGSGKMNMEGMGSLNIVATAPNVKGQVDKTAEGGEPLPFTILVNGEDVQIEIPNCGIFPGKILRTTK